MSSWLHSFYKMDCKLSAIRRNGGRDDTKNIDHRKVGGEKSKIPQDGTDGTGGCRAVALCLLTCIQLHCACNTVNCERMALSQLTK